MEENAISWMVEYAAFHTWRAFKEDMKEINRDLIQGLLNFSDKTAMDSKTTLAIHRMVFLCRLFDGEDYKLTFGADSEEDEEDNVTVLENAIKLLDEIVTESDDVSPDDMKTIRLQLMTQAVFVCLRDRNFSTGRKVFEQLDAEFKMKEFRRLVSAALHSNNPNHLALKEKPYEKMQQEVAHLLAPIFKVYDQPYLLKITEQKANEEKRLCKSALKKFDPSTLIFSVVEVKLLMKKFNVPESTLQETKKDSSTWVNIGKCRQNKEKLLETMPAFLKETTPTPDDEGKTTDEMITVTNHQNASADHQQAKPPKCLSVQNGVLSPTSSSSELDKSLCSRLGERLTDKPELEDVKPAGLRRNWTRQEEETLFCAVRKYGVGQWSKMKDLFSMRTSVNIKDKWRNMIKHPQRYTSFAAKHGDFMNITSN